MIGIVYYSDDPHKRVFRLVCLYPWETEKEFNNPFYVTDGIPKDRQKFCVLEVVSDYDPRIALTATPAVKPTDPLVDPSSAYVGFDPTEDHLIEQQLDMVGVGPTDVVIDLGCGDGRVLVAAAKRGAKKVIGVDLDPEMVRQTQESLRSAGIDGEVRNEDAFQTSFAGVTVAIANMSFVHAKKIRGILPAGVRLVAVDSDQVRLF